MVKNELFTIYDKRDVHFPVCQYIYWILVAVGFLFQSRIENIHPSAIEWYSGR